MLKKKSNYAFQDHIDLDFLGKPGFNPDNFDVKSFLRPNGRLVRAGAAADILVKKPDFLNNFINGLNVTAENPYFDYTVHHECMNNYIFVYINELGVYAMCKKTTVMFMLTKLFFDLELSTKIPKELNYVERYNLKEINTYLNKPLDNYSYIYEYAAQIVDELEDCSSMKYISPYVYRFRNNYQTHQYYQHHEAFEQYGSLYYFNIDYNDDLILLAPQNYEPIYINTNGYFYYAYTEDDSVKDMLETI